ncbi:MAG: helix-hairpin-helix domain-containing protein [Syntrophales bacterium]
MEGINGSEEKNTKLSTGRTVNINKDDQISIGEMSAAKKLFFNIPIDVNQTSIYDLMLIPGIGEKTAWQIIHFREMNGKLQKIESLMKIPGIKEKRLAGIRKYLYVEDNWTTD